MDFTPNLQQYLTLNANLFSSHLKKDSLKYPPVIKKFREQFSTYCKVNLQCCQTKIVI